MRILIPTTINSSVIQFMARDVAHGFRRLGHDVEVVRERWPGEPYNAAILIDVVMWYRPDLVFLVDQLRANNPQLWPIKPVYAHWLQDDLPHLWDKKSIFYMQDRDVFFFSFPKLMEKALGQGYPEARCHLLPPGVNHDLFRRVSMPDGVLTVGFPCNVGHPGHSDPEAKAMLRIEPVRWLIEMGVPIKLWGEGWQNPEFGRYWQGIVRNGPALRDAYASCHAVLHVNNDAPILCHQRPYEALAVGRPVLARCPAGGDRRRNTFASNTKDELAQHITMIRTTLEKGLGEEVAAECAMDVEKDGYEARCQAVLDIAGGLK